MSGTSSTTVVTMGEVGGGGGGCYYRPPFTAVQWQELEHQAMIYKYLLAGLPVPPELVVPIRRSFEGISSRFFSHPSLSYCSHYGKKFDPEPGRCRRTDGKKWRCSKDAYPDSKYCERHMHRGRNRSRKPVESHSASQSLSAAMPQSVTGSSSSSGIFQSSGGGIYQNLPFYSVGNSEGLYSGRNVTKFQTEPGLYGNDNREYRYIPGLPPDADSEDFSPEASGNNGNRALVTVAGQSSELHMDHAFDPMVEIAMSKHPQQHCFFGNEIVSSEPVKQEQHSAHPFFDEWPTIKESWSNLGGGGSEKNSISKTPLSICTPVAYSEFSSRNTRSPDDD